MESSSLQPEAAAALPATYVIPRLQNQDPYLQYRFGVAIARARGRGQETPHEEFDPSSSWGENQVLVSYANDVDDEVDEALKEIGLSPSDKRLISTARSEETSSVNKTSPVPARQTNRYGV